MSHFVESSSQATGWQFGIFFSQLSQRPPKLREVYGIIWFSWKMYLSYEYFHLRSTTHWLLTLFKKSHSLTDKQYFIIAMLVQCFQSWTQLCSSGRKGVVPAGCWWLPSVLSLFWCYQCYDVSLCLILSHSLPAWSWLKCMVNQSWFE